MTIEAIDSYIENISISFRYSDQNLKSWMWIFGISKRSIFSESEVKFWTLLQRSYSSAVSTLSLVSSLFSKRNSIFFQNTLRLKDEKLQLSKSLISPSCSLCSVEFLFRSLSIPKCQSGSYKKNKRQRMRS